MPPRLPTSEFLAALERSEVLTEAKLRQLGDRFVRGICPPDSVALAAQLVYEGILTKFQARRLLEGKKSLVFGRYILLDHIGIGAMGRVFKARHRLMDRIVALKVISPSETSAKNSVPRLFQEMKIVGLLDHPNVVRAFDADQHDDAPYIVMEYLEGENFEQVLQRRGPLPPDEVMLYMAQASRGLAHAHQKGVIHRDVKPTNLFLVHTGMVKILDLGLGALVGVSKYETRVLDTDEGIVVGTTDYMSPEQVTGQAIDARTDLFSLGCTMYRLLTGTYAFPGVTREDRLLKRIRDRYVPIREVRPEVPTPFVTILDRLLCPRPDDRFSSAEEVAEALEAANPAADDPRPGTRAQAGANRPPDRASSPVAEPEPPALDWSRIESGLRSKGDSVERAPPSRSGDVSKRYQASSGRLSSYRRSIEDEGADSGRKAHQQYRRELIQLNRTLAEERAQDEGEEPRSIIARCLESLGEGLGDFMANPHAGAILLALLGIIVILALAVFLALP
jgi:serine/threonine-protein kinase